MPLERTSSKKGRHFSTRRHKVSLTLCSAQFDILTLRMTSSVAPDQARSKEAAVCRQIKDQSVCWYQISSNSSKRTIVSPLRAPPSPFQLFVKRWWRRLLGQQDTARWLKVLLRSSLLSCRQWLKIVRNFTDLAPWPDMYFVRTCMKLSFRHKRKLNHVQ